jgi:hypothetical protein
VGFWFNGANQGQWRLDSPTMYALQSPGAMTAVTTNLVLTASVTVLAHVDYGQKLAEKREDNNTYTQNVACATSASGSPPQAGDAVRPQLGAVQLGPNPLPPQGGEVALSVRASDNIGIAQVLLTQIKPTGEQNSGIVPLVAGTPMNGEWRTQWRIAANSTAAPQTYTIKVKLNDAAGNAVEAQPIQLTVAGGGAGPAPGAAAHQRPQAATQTPRATQGPHVPHPPTPPGLGSVPPPPTAQNYGSPVTGPPPVGCKHSKFDTTMVAAACQAGGQKAAKDEMTRWMTEAKKRMSNLACQTCHMKVAGDYPLKPTGLQLYKDLGGQ